MILSNHIAPSSFLPRLASSDLAEAITACVATAVTDLPAVDVPDLTAEVLRREQEASTVVGGGLAIPHVRHETIDRLRLAMATLQEPLKMSGTFDRPVDIIILILGPGHDPRPMLLALSRLARLVKHSEFAPALRRAQSPAAMAKALRDAETALSSRL